MYSRIENDILIEFDDRDLVDGKFVIPSNVKIIWSSAFSFSKIQTLVIPEGVKNIKFGAFENCKNLTKINIPEMLARLEDCVFMGCRNLKEIALPSIISHIGDDIFLDCNSLERITIGEKHIECNYAVIHNFKQCYLFASYADENNKFIPDINIILNTKPNEIENFYKYSKRWQMIFNKYDKAWGVKDKENEVGHFALHDAKNNLHQICVILGVFQNHSEQEWNKISEFIEQNILTLEPNTLHSMCGGFEVRENGYNDEFAKFFIKNYTPPRMEDDVELCFMERLEVKDDDIPDYALTEEEYEMYTKPQVVRYLGRAYNNWDKVKFAYPNRTVLNHREHASENNSLTVEDVINAIKITKYDNVDEDNEEMATVVGAYGYTQQEFEELQNIWNKGKCIKPEQMMLRVEEDNFVGKGVKYELLAKDNPEGLILGEKTNCCQTINDAGKSCMIYGATKPNSGFIKFTLGGKLVAQSWVWYNDLKNVVCLDNIEIPTIWLNRFKKSENLTKSFQQCLIRLANGFINEMEKNGHKVDNVTVGAGCNDFDGLERFEKTNEILNRFLWPYDYVGYSDARDMQYIISGVRFEDLYTERVTL